MIEAYNAYQKMIETANDPSIDEYQKLSAIARHIAEESHMVLDQMSASIEEMERAHITLVKIGIESAQFFSKSEEVIE